VLIRAISSLSGGGICHSEKLLYLSHWNIYHITFYAFLSRLENNEYQLYTIFTPLSYVQFYALYIL